MRIEITKTGIEQTRGVFRDCWFVDVIGRTGIGETGYFRSNVGSSYSEGGAQRIADRVELDEAHQSWSLRPLCDNSTPPMASS